MGKPDFSGRWHLSPTESRLEIGVPDVAEFEIEHHEPRFRLTRTLAFGGQGNSLSLVLTTDGAPTEFRQGDLEFVARLSWDEDALVSHADVVRTGARGTNDVVYRLADDGRALVAEERYRGPDRSYDNLWVLRRTIG